MLNGERWQPSNALSCVESPGAVLHKIKLADGCRAKHELSKLAILVFSVRAVSSRPGPLEHRKRHADGNRSDADVCRG